MQSNKRITKYLPTIFQQKKQYSITSSNSIEKNESSQSAYLKKQQREQAKLFEQMELENIKEIFLQNKVEFKGRRKAVTENELADQIRHCDSVINSSPIFPFKKNRAKNSSLKLDDEWDLKEIKKIVMYQAQPKRQFSTEGDKY